MLSRHVASPTGTRGPTASTSMHTAPIAADERVEVPLVGSSHQTQRREEDDHADRADPDDQPPPDVAGHGEREGVVGCPGDRLGLTDRYLDEADRECRPAGQRQAGTARHPARPAETETGEERADDHHGRTDDTAGPEVRRDVVEGRDAGRDARGGSARADVDDVTDGRHQGGDGAEERRDEDEPDAEPFACGWERGGHRRARRTTPVRSPPASPTW